MKKKIISVGLALLLAITSASAFSDISDAKLSQTANVLNALGIMQGVGGDRFDPSSSLTRAQFCKLAVTAMGCSDVSPYGSYTIFPDVRQSHWAAPYINAAVRDSELKKYNIIRGYADGTFGPDKTVNFGEACTMLLRMLGYKEEDVGPFWPADYIARAKSLGLTTGVSLTDAQAAVKRSDAATMLLNTLGAKMKDSETLLLSKVASGTVEDCILLATSATDPNLAPNEAVFYEAGVVDHAKPRKTLGTLDKSMLGAYGTLVIGKDDNKVALGIVPNNNKVETLSVTSVSAEAIHTDAQTLKPDRSANLYLASEKKMSTFGELWSSILPGDTLTMYYDEYGTLKLMAVLPKAAGTGNNTSFVYGLATSANIPSNYTIVKNGAVIERSKIQKYDVVTLDTANKQAVVSDTRLSGVYWEGTPTVSYPQTVTMYNTPYTISDSAAKTFENLKIKDHITLLFDAFGNVVAAYPKSTVSADMQGIVTNVKDSQATIALTNGLTLQPKCEGEKIDDLMGRLVTVGQSSNGNCYLTKRSLSGKASGNWSIKENMLGTNKVSPKVKVYEEVLSGAPLNQIALGNIKETTVSSSQIRYTVSDNAGTITNIVLGDVTGDSWIYGIGYGSKGDPDKDERSSVTITQWKDSISTKETFPVISLPNGLGGNPIGIPKGYSKETPNSSFDILPLALVDTVELSAFDGVSGVRTKSGYYNLADDIGVYVSAQQKMISLQTAKNNYTKFRVYANKTAENGGKIRVIVAS